MKRQHYRPKLNKRFFDARDGHDIYSVNAFAIRNLAQPDEEFTNFATRDEFPDLIPDGEIWISERAIAREGEFFIANAIARLKALEAGESEDTAYTMGLNADRRSRAARTGIRYRAGRPSKRIATQIYVQHYFTLPDEQFPINVWIVDGLRVRSTYKTDYTEGGHGYVYPWVPKNEIWIEKALDRGEMSFIVAHEYIELRLMRDEKLDYDRAHECCSEMEFDLRKAQTRSSFPELSRRRFRKSDLPKLTRPEFFDYVQRHYQHSFLRRARAIVSRTVRGVLGVR
jgi:hypothetical protein